MGDSEQGPPPPADATRDLLESAGIAWQPLQRLPEAEAVGQNMFQPHAASPPARPPMVIDGSPPLSAFLPQLDPGAAAASATVPAAPPPTFTVRSGPVAVTAVPATPIAHHPPAAACPEAPGVAPAAGVVAAAAPSAAAPQPQHGAVAPAAPTSTAAATTVAAVAAPVAAAVPGMMPPPQLQQQPPGQQPMMMPAMVPHPIPGVRMVPVRLCTPSGKSATFYMPAPPTMDQHLGQQQQQPQQPLPQPQNGGVVPQPSPPQPQHFFASGAPPALLPHPETSGQQQQQQVASPSSSAGTMVMMPSGMAPVPGAAVVGFPAAPAAARFPGGAAPTPPQQQPQQQAAPAMEGGGAVGATTVATQPPAAPESPAEKGNSGATADQVVAAPAAAAEAEAVAVSPAAAATPRAPAAPPPPRPGTAPEGPQQQRRGRRPPPPSGRGGAAPAATTAAVPPTAPPPTGKEEAAASRGSGSTGTATTPSGKKKGATLAAPQQPKQQRQTAFFDPLAPPQPAAREPSPARRHGHSSSAAREPSPAARGRNHAAAAPSGKAQQHKSRPQAAAPPSGPAGTASTTGSNLSPESMDKLRAKLRAAAYNVGGQDWAKLFRQQDKDRSGHISFKEFLSMCRRVLRLNPDDFPDGELKAVFSQVDEDRSGEVSIEELVVFVDRGNGSECDGDADEDDEVNYDFEDDDDDEDEEVDDEEQRRREEALRELGGQPPLAPPPAFDAGDVVYIQGQLCVVVGLKDGEAVAAAAGQPQEYVVRRVEDGLLLSAESSAMMGTGYSAANWAELRTPSPPQDPAGGGAAAAGPPGVGGQMMMPFGDGNNAMMMGGAAAMMGGGGFGGGGPMDGGGFPGQQQQQQQFEPERIRNHALEEAAQALQQAEINELRKSVAKPTSKSNKSKRHSSGLTPGGGLVLGPDLDDEDEKAQAKNKKAPPATANAALMTACRPRPGFGAPPPDLDRVDDLDHGIRRLLGDAQSKMGGDHGSDSSAPVNFALQAAAEALGLPPPARPQQQQPHHDLSPSHHGGGGGGCAMKQLQQQRCALDGPSLPGLEEFAARMAAGAAAAEAPDGSSSGQPPPPYAGAAGSMASASLEGPNHHHGHHLAAVPQQQYANIGGAGSHFLPGEASPQQPHHPAGGLLSPSEFLRGSAVVGGQSQDHHRQSLHEQLGAEAAPHRQRHQYLLEGGEDSDDEEERARAEMEMEDAQWGAAGAAVVPGLKSAGSAAPGNKPSLPPPSGPMRSPMRSGGGGAERRVSGPAVVKEQFGGLQLGDDEANDGAEERLARSEMMHDVLHQVNRLSGHPGDVGDWAQPPPPRSSAGPPMPKLPASFVSSFADDGGAGDFNNALFGGLLDAPLPEPRGGGPRSDKLGRARGGRARAGGGSGGGGPPTAPGPWRPAPASRGNPRFLEKALGLDVGGLDAGLFPPGEKGPGPQPRRSSANPTSGRPGHRGHGQPNSARGNNPHKMMMQTTTLPPVRAPAGRPRTGGPSSTGYAMYGGGGAVPYGKPKTPRGGGFQGMMPDPAGMAFATGHGTAMEDFSPKGTHLEGLVYGTY